MIATDDLRELLRVQLPPMGAAAKIAGLIVAPDVWAQFVATVPKVDGPPSPFSWRVTVNRWLPPGMIVPVDRDGYPLATWRKGNPRIMMTPSARKQAQRLAAARGRELALRHLAAAAHLGERNRLLKRLRDPIIAGTILDGFLDLRIVARWRPVMVRAFQRAAIGAIHAATAARGPLQGTIYEGGAVT